MNEGHIEWAKAFSEAIKPKERLTVSKWADKYRILPSQSAEPGPWRTSRTPYLEEIMDELSFMSRAQKVVLMKASQTGGTEMGLNWVGYTISYDPTTMMIIWPGLQDVQTNTKLRITPLIDSTPEIKEKVLDHKGRKDGSSARFKNFDGGALIINGCNSAAALKSVPCPRILLDEVDEFPDDVEGQGDPVALVMVRSRTFGSKRKALLVSTPTYKGKSKIEKEFKASDQRYYYVPCPHCKEKQILIWDHIQYQVEDNENGDPIVTKASYFCKHCGEEIEEHHKSWMLSKKSGAEWIKHNPKSKIPGFHIAAFYSPLGWYSWADAAQEFIEAGNNEEKMKTWVNTCKGETYEQQGESPDHEMLYNRREGYDIGTVPREAIFLTAAADIQKDRIEVLVQGWGKGRERWNIDHKVIPGEVIKKEVWEELEQYLASTFKNSDGKLLGISKAAIDSGYETQRVYNFCKRYDIGKVLPVKGREELTVMVGTPSAVDLKNEITGRKKKKGVRIWPLGVNLIKDEVFGDLMLSPPDDILDGFPAGFIHFPQFDEEFFRQLTAEKKIIVKNSRGFTKSVYEKTYDRNEILDLHVYNRAVSHIIGIDRLNESGWKRLELKNTLALKCKTKENKLKERQQRKTARKKKGSEFWDR